MNATGALEPGSPTEPLDAATCGRTDGTPHVEPHALVDALVGAGWRIVGTSRGAYVRLRRRGRGGGRAPSVVVPLNRGAADFGYLMGSALVTVRDLSDDTWHRAVEPLLGDLS